MFLTLVVQQTATLYAGFDTQMRQAQEVATFVPAAKITEKQKLSIATNYLGTPEAMYREDGEAVWTCELNSYGKVRNFQGGSKTDCPFRYQGQYEDAETGLYYNRFRYYSPEEGVYLSQDPVSLLGSFTTYGYVHDPNSWVDILGLFKTVIFPKDKVISQVTIKMQGKREWDYRAANEAAGIKSVRGKTTIDAHVQQYGDVVWHHASYNADTNECVMQLVRTPDHIAKIPHEGAVKQFEAATGTTYGEAGAKAKAKELNKHCQS
jgi:RHS repeat-associated protein